MQKKLQNEIGDRLEELGPEWVVGDKKGLRFVFRVVARSEACHTASYKTHNFTDIKHAL